MISQIGPIEKGRCIQAKGKTYSVADLCGDEKLAEKFKDGLYVVYYLCPTDYHRVHAPLDGDISRMIHNPGALWPVNSWSTANIENLFGINERVTLQIKARVGEALLVFVGATNVGQIELTKDPSVHTNLRPWMAESKLDKSYSPKIPILRGEELGVFHMGSTVVMIYPKSIRLQRDDWEKFKGKSVQVGQAFL